MGRINEFFIRNVWAAVVLGVVTASLVTWVLLPGRSLGAVLVRTCVYSAAGIAFALARRRKEKRAAGGSMDRLVRVERWLRTGEVPSAPEDREAMREIVGRRLRQTRHRVAALIFLVALFAAVAVLVGLTAQPLQTVAFVAFGVAFMGWMVWSSNRQDRRLRTMRDALGSGQPDGVAPGAAGGGSGA
ncbi:hypothetical protein EV284_4119 [Streptomyces sp. BK022]|uniref:hypothetical protein n=1 Tax=Streptomyces sp. BK022 TaxID=2512123 RepID=UPI00102A817B|nr:hypothetical protein [Streptomyces sp. BK022]RZU36625.1 hypothetical protein EV284_4119 [Streptomyces sp. BK022]